MTTIYQAAALAAAGAHPEHRSSWRESRFPRSRTCEILHKALPRKRHNAAAEASAIQADALSAAVEDVHLGHGDV
jgi:hypothetical protein